MQIKLVVIIPHELQGACSKVKQMAKSSLYIRFSTNSIDAAVLHCSAGDLCACIATASAIHRTPNERINTSTKQTAKAEDKLDESKNG
jgi:hypothetical protein